MQLCTVIMSTDEHTQILSVYFNDRRKMTTRLMGLFPHRHVECCKNHTDPVRLYVEYDTGHMSDVL